MSPVSEILETKGAMVLSVEGNESVFDAISLMAEVNIGAVLVQNDDNIMGIFTERDYLQRIALKSLSSKETRVEDVMTKPVISADPGDSVQQCMETMTTCHCRHLPVVKAGKLLGIVSIGDLVKRMLDEKQQEIEQLNQYYGQSHTLWNLDLSVPEGECTRCAPSLVASYKEKKDWCEEHERPDSCPGANIERRGAGVRHAKMLRAAAHRRAAT